MRSSTSFAVALLLLCSCGGAFTTAIGGDGGPQDELPDSGSLAQETGDEPAVVATEDRDAGHDAGASTVGVDGGDAEAVVHDAGSEGDSGTCLNDLSNVHGDFHVDFDVLATTAVQAPLLEQRASCDQYSVQWAIGEGQTGNLATYFYDGTTGFQLLSVGRIDDGSWHHVVVARVALTFSITIDGALDSSVPSAGWSPPALPLLQVGRDACLTAFAGQLRDVCITRP